eukprot:scaffold13.g340.t1
MRDFSAQKERARQQQLAEAQRQRVARVRRKLAAAQERQRRRAAPGQRSEPAGPDAEFLVEDYWESEDEGEAGAAGGPGAALGSARKRGPADAGLATNGSSSSSGEGGDKAPLGEAAEPELPSKRQVIFASRTHSQLSQFVGELHRTPFGDEMSLVALGSRKALCINEAVLRLGSPGLVNERCLELQKPSSGGKKKVAGAAAAKGRCPYLAAGTGAAATVNDLILAQPMDIEELGKLGRRKLVCPYYASRRAVPEADIILAPYSALLETRESLGLKLEGAVVIVDEAHNLADAVNSSHSAELTSAQAATAHHQLAAYLSRFAAQLAPANCRNIQLLIRVADTLAKAAAAAAGQAAPSAGTGGGGQGQGRVSTVNDFLFRAGLDNVNMLHLVRYVRESKAVFKVAGYWQAQQAKAAATAAAGDAAGAEATAASAPGVEGNTGALHALVAFLQALTNEDADGRIVVRTQPVQQAQRQQAPQAPQAPQAQQAGLQDQQQGVLKFVLLNAAAHFARVVASAHAVVLASGTLSPLASVLQLFPGTPPERIHHFSCGHVVVQDRLLALALGAGPSGAALDFRHASRSAPATLDELGRLLCNVCQVVPGGVVVFFPSFRYLSQAGNQLAALLHCGGGPHGHLPLCSGINVHPSTQAQSHWRASGALAALQARKRLFCEPRAAIEVEACLAEYATACSSGSSKGSGGGGGGEAENAGGVANRLAAAGGGGGAGGGPCSHGAGGAVMLCVVGGKLSEGINFGDDLGRCVVMVGLPYPNPSDPELQERIAFADRTAAAAAAGAAGPAPASASAAAGGAAGRQYYQDLCMKAVNQCIGRVIRHRGDYAAIILADVRYMQGVGAGGQLAGPLAKLPGWIQQSLHVSGGFADAFGRLVRFCKQLSAAQGAAAAGAAEMAAASAGGDAQ